MGVRVRVSLSTAAGSRLSPFIMWLSGTELRGSDLVGIKCPFLLSHLVDPCKIKLDFRPWCASQDCHFHFQVWTGKCRPMFWVVCHFLETEADMRQEASLHREYGGSSPRSHWSPAETSRCLCNLDARPCDPPLGFFRVNVTKASWIQILNTQLLAESIPTTSVLQALCF